MKKVFTILAAVLLTATVWAQSPEKMSYQAVVRDLNDNLVTSQAVGIKISILQGSVSGSSVYEEIYNPNPSTNTNGLVTVEIGDGIPILGNFTLIDWANGPYFIKTEIDPAGGTSYSITGTSQLLSVPYALHAKTAETVTGGITETDPVYTGSEAANIDANDITNLGNLSGTNTGDQDISGITTNATDIATNEQAIQDTASQIRADIPDVSGFLTSESDPVFGAWDKSTGISITESQISDLSHFTTGDETDPIYGSSVASGITGTDTTNWNNKLDSEGDPVFGAWDKSTGISITESQISDLSHFTTGDETDPVYSGSEAANITATDITNLSNLSGVNTGDEDLSTLALKSDVLELDNTTAFTPDADYEPATKKYVDDNAGTTYSVGDFAQGGIVFWVDETGQHGLVCAKDDQSTGVRWYAGTHGGVTRATGDGPFSGELNTAIIISSQVSIGDDGSDYAAQICNDLQITEGGKTYGDWYLPSKEELNLMYQNKATIDGTAGNNGGSGFASSPYYWSSTESDSYNARGQSFVNGYQAYSPKTATYRVRAVRAF